MANAFKRSVVLALVGGLGVPGCTPEEAADGASGSADQAADAAEVTEDAGPLRSDASGTPAPADVRPAADSAAPPADSAVDSAVDSAADFPDARLSVPDLGPPDAAAPAPDVGPPEPDGPPPLESDAGVAPVADLGAPEPDGPPPLEPDAGVAPDPSLGASILACWFRDYAANGQMGSFALAEEGAGVDLFGQRFGGLRAAFTQSIGGLTNPLTHCLAQVGGQAIGSMSVPEAVAALAMLMPYARPYDPWLGASFYRPDLIEWAAEHLIPTPDETIDGLPIQLIYQEVLASYARLGVEAYLHLQEGGFFAPEVEAYGTWLESASVGSRDVLCPWAIDFEPPEASESWFYIACRFSMLPPPDAQGWAPAVRTGAITPAEFAFFWLRRGYDGTDTAVFAALRVGFRLHDADWYAGLQQRFPNAAVAW